MKQLLLGFVLTLALSAPAMAQQPSASASHLTAATDLLRMMNLEQTMLATASATATAMTQRDGSLAPYHDVILKWAQKFMTWELFCPRLAQVYAETFSEAELKALTEFYRTPAGQKVLAMMPTLARRSIAIGNEVAAEHVNELKEMVQQRAGELEEKKP